MITTNEVLDSYSVVYKAKIFNAAHYNLIDAILAHQGEKTPLTVRGMGEEIMGEAYHKPFTWWNGEKANFRISEARTMTSYLTQAFRKLVKLGVMTFEDRRDMEHPVTFTDHDFHFVDKDGNYIPDKVEVTINSGEKIKISAAHLPGVRQEYGDFPHTVYPKVRYYYFK